MPSLEEETSRFMVGTQVVKNIPKEHPNNHCKNDWIEGKIKSVGMIGGKEMYIASFTTGTERTTQEEMQLPVEDIEWRTLAHRYLGQRIAKKFEQGTFEGSVVDVKPPDNDYNSILFTVLYDDDDVEDLSEEEVEHGVCYYTERKADLEDAEMPKRCRKRQKISNTNEPDYEMNGTHSNRNKRTDVVVSVCSPEPVETRSGLRQRKVVSYADIADMDSEEDSVPKKRGKQAKRTKVRDDDSDVAMEDCKSEESEGLDADDDDDDGRDEVHNRKTKRPAKVPKGRKIKKDPEVPEKKQSRRMCDAFEPIDRPLYCKLSLDEIQRTKQFLDPCGQEATDDIIGRLVGEQVDKILPLLKRSLDNHELIGSSTNPLQLGTACSGTDAPALAMTLVQENLESRGLSGRFHYEHKFSCEIDPFKQAYLARNFDSILYPDICKLVDEEPRDAYGQVQPIPEYNIFVAGTSCKNFSMLRSKKRMDIEDKGCSGETFLAAVEHIFKEKPPFCILENVQNAPWDKMAEYIEGKIKLSSCDDKKAISGMKKGDKQVLEFIRDDGHIVVDRVPTVFGVRCGSVVAGFTRPGESQVRAVKWPPKKKGSCTLEELVAANKISKPNDTLVFDVPVRYHTERVKVDTKDFGLPQTRNRMYLFVWQASDGADLGGYWKAIVEHLKSPVRHSLEAFVLQDNHDVIRVFREALRGPSGRQTKRGAFMEDDFWTSTSANLPHNKNTRVKLGLEDTARPITNWGPHGKRNVPPHYWLEYINCCYQRVLDMIDILHASAARDAECHDSSFASFVWNLSQNASKEKHRTACPGISSCITPGGEFLLPHFGRPLLGCEKLLLQGIPYFRLALGTETEVQLGDLAGNAMSLTVVCATLLAAITCKQLRLEVKGQQHKAFLAQPANIISSILKKLPERENACPIAKNCNVEDLEEGLSFVKELAALADEAINTSIWCTCETSGQNSATQAFLQCEISRVSCCRLCCDSTAGYNLKSHTIAERILDAESRDLESIDKKFRTILPSTLLFTAEALTVLPKTEHPSHDLKQFANLHFNLHRVSRERRAWRIVYFARQQQVGPALGELSIRVGEFSSFSPSGCRDKGAIVELRSFLPALVAPLRYGNLGPVAVFKFVDLNKGNHQQAWMAADERPTKGSLQLLGRQPQQSFRAEVGLTEIAAEGVKSGTEKSSNRKAFSEAKGRGESYRWVYPQKWNEWPEIIEIRHKGKTFPKNVLPVDGVYKRAKCRGTFNQGAIWIRQEQPKLFLLIKPEVSRTGADRAIISTSMSHEDLSEIVAMLPPSWQPCDALNDGKQAVQGVEFFTWSPVPEMKLHLHRSKIIVSSPKVGEEMGTLLTVGGLTNGEIDMLSAHVEEKEKSTIELPVHTGQRSQQTIRAFNAVCVSKILQHAASSQFTYNLHPNAKWQELDPSDPNVVFGQCQRVFPPRPKEVWFKDSDRNEWDRQYEAGESRAFFQALIHRPRAFNYEINKVTKTLSIGMDPEVVAHYAAGHLTRGRGINGAKEVSVSFKLSASQFHSDPVLDGFKVPSCQTHELTDVSLKRPFKLYDRQQKVVSKMLAIENGETIFQEVEMYEEYMPGSTGWSLIAKAQRDAMISGGVIADAIGAGKTVISIALILKGLKEAKENVEPPRRSSATLVVVPPHLIDQWDNEISKFTTGLKVFRVYDVKSLRELALRDILRADCVICPIDVLESEGYFEHLLKESKINEQESARLPRYTGQKELSGAKGTWLPAGSADPYGGANNSLNQRRRNASARYTHLYLKAIHSLRSQKFSEKNKGVPIEYFEWERIIVDEIHESLCCTKEAKEDDHEESEAQKKKESGTKGIFKEKNRRAGREFLGIMTRDARQRPLVARKAFFGLTGTPLLDSPSRVIELASLIGCTYVLGLSSHWRKLEKESCRDIFLHYYLEPKQSRIVRKNLYEKCQDYISTACCRNKVGDEMCGIRIKEHRMEATMDEEDARLYLQSQSGISQSKKSFAITPEDFDVSAGHNITKFLQQNADLECRKTKLVDICNAILDKDPTTKIIVFTDGRIGGGIAARNALQADKRLGCTWLDESDSTEICNKKISWYQHGDATDEDRARPRILVLHFEHAAGLNLQSECYNLVLFTPLYIGMGGVTSDPVSDVSTELQAIGRVYRLGQTKPTVNIYRIEARGPNNESCLDGHLIRRNTDEETISMAINSGD